MVYEFMASDRVQKSVQNYAAFSGQITQQREQYYVGVVLFFKTNFELD